MVTGLIGAVRRKYSRSSLMRLTLFIVLYACTVPGRADIIVTGTVDAVDNLTFTSAALTSSLVDQTFAQEVSIEITGGQLLVNNGSILTAGSTVPIDSGTVIVSGAGSRINLISDGTAGNQNRADLRGLASAYQILDGGVIDAATDTGNCSGPNCSIFLGSYPGAQATLLIDGVGSQLQTINFLEIAFADTEFGIFGADSIATVDVRNGGAINSQFSVLSAGLFGGGFLPGQATRATVNVTGPGSQWNATDFTVASGQNAVATLNVTAGGAINTSTFSSSTDATAVSDILVDGTGSQINANSSMFVGRVGTSSLLLTNGGRVAVGGATPNSQLFIGFGGNAAVTLSGGSEITVRDDDAEDSLNQGGFVGFGGTATVNINSGSLLRIAGGAGTGNSQLNQSFINIGQSDENEGAGDGVVNVAGEGTRLEVLGNGSLAVLNVGLANNVSSLPDTGRGVLNVTGGADVLVNGGTGADGFVSLARGGNSDGEINLRGSGTTMTVTGGLGGRGRFFVGNDFESAVGDGNGRLTVSDNALLRLTGSPGAFFVAGFGTGNGSVTVDSGGRIEVEGSLRISVDSGLNSSATGLVAVNDTGVIEAEVIIVGNGVNPLTNGTLTGTGTVVGSVLVQTGGLLSSQAPLGTLTLDGDLSVVGSGIVNVAATSRLTTRSTLISDNGVLQGSGALVTDLLEVRGNGALLLDSLDGVRSTIFKGANFITPTFEFGAGTTQLLTLLEATNFEVTADLLIGVTAGSRQTLVVSGLETRLGAQGRIILGNGAPATVAELQVDAGAIVDAVGNIELAAGSRLSVTGANTRVNSTGNLLLNGGALVLNDGATIQAADIIVGNNGLIGGSGSIFAQRLFVNSGGTIAPGNSPGIINVRGDVTLAGGELLFEIAGSQPGQFDVLNVDGNLDLQTGTFRLELLNGFVPQTGDSFDIITATGNATIGPGVSLLFNGLGPDFDLTFSNNGQLNIGALTFVGFDIQQLVGFTPNQSGMAVYLDDICPRIERLTAPTVEQADLDRVCGNLRNSRNTTEQIAAGLDALTPDEILGIVDTLLHFTTVQHGNLSQRLSGLRSGAARVNVTGLDIVTDHVRIAGSDLQQFVDGLVGGAAGGTDDFAKWGFFSDGNFHFGDKRRTVNETGFDFDTVNITLGADYRLRSNLFVGAAFGYNEINADFDTGGGMLMKATTLTLMGTYFVGESYYLDVLATYGWNKADTSRYIRYTDVGGDFSRRATGDTDGTQFVASVGTGYDFTREKWIFGPHVGSNFTEIALDDFNEDGALGVDLSLPGQVSRSFTANVGGHLSYTMTPEWGVLVPYARLDYVHEFQDSAQTQNVRFVADQFEFDPLDPTRPARIRTDAADADYWTWSIGAHAQFVHGIAAFINYRGTAGLKDLDVSEVSVGIRFERSF